MKKMGAPIKEIKKSKDIRFRVTEDEKGYYLGKAKDYGFSITDFLKNAADEYIKNHN